MNIYKIYDKYQIEKSDYTKPLGEFKKLDSSVDVEFIGNKYFIDKNRIKKFFTEELIINIDNSEVYENMSSLNIEGINSSKAASSKAQEFVEEYKNTNDGDKVFYGDNKKDISLSIKKMVDEKYDELPEKKRPSRIHFYSNVGLSIATELVEGMEYQFNSIESIMKIYSALTISGLALEEKDRLEKDSIFRQGEVEITDGLNIIDKGIKAKDVLPKMKKLTDLLNQPSEMDNCMIASIAHFLFVEIHPYYDGNGRMARILIKNIAKNENSSGSWAKHINKIIDWTKSSYYKAIQITRKTKDLTFFIMYMDWVYHKSLYSENKIFNEKQKLAQVGKGISPMKEQVIIYLLTFDNLFISWKDIQKSVVPARDITEQGLKKLLNEMVEDGILIKQKVDNNNMYKILMDSIDE